MFICGICKEQQPARVAAVPVVLETRSRSYLNEEGEEIGFGTEIVRETRACHDCAQEAGQ